MSAAAATSRLPVEFVEDIDFLIKSSSRKSTIASESSQHISPALKLRPRSASSEGRFTVCQCVWRARERALNLLLQKRTHTNVSAAAEETCAHVFVEVDVFIPSTVSEPFFCLSADHMSSRPDVSLSAAVANRCNERVVQNGRSLNLLELVAQIEVAATELTATSLDLAIQTQRSRNIAQDAPHGVESRLWDILSSDNAGCRLLLALLDTACQSRKRETLTDPNPFSDAIIHSSEASLLMPHTASSGRKEVPSGRTNEGVAGLVDVMDYIIGARGIRHEECRLPISYAEIMELNHTLLSFLCWIFLGGARTTLSFETRQPRLSPTSFTSSSPSASQPSSTSKSEPASSIGASAPKINHTASWSFRAVHRGDSPRFTYLKDSKGTVIAYHGTAMPNVWSCIQNGLLSMSGSEFQTNGAAFGDGVYLSTEESVALNFAPRYVVTKRLGRILCHTEAFSSLRDQEGSGLKFVFECEVINDPTVSSDKQGSGQGRDNHGNKRSPHSTYLVVKDPAMIRVRRLLVYNDAQSESGGARPASRAKKVVPQARAARDSNPNGTTSSDAKAVPAQVTATQNADSIHDRRHIVNRTNGDDVKSRVILCSVVVFLLMALWAATFYSQRRSTRYYDQL